MKTKTSAHIDLKNPDKLRIAIIIARFNSEVCERLKSAAIETLTTYGVDENRIDIVYTPGAFEIPGMAQLVAEKKTYNAMIAIGVVIKGDTAHFEYVAGPATEGIMQVALEKHVPIMNCILTLFNQEQADLRSADNENNKGREAAIAALEVISTQQSL